MPKRKIGFSNPMIPQMLKKTQIQSMTLYMKNKLQTKEIILYNLKQ